MTFGPAETPSDWVPTSTPVSARFHRGHFERVAGHFFEFRVVNRNSSG